MSAFETFVQIELPKRPYLNTDVPQETVIIRRGPGPRQLDAVTIVEGEVLAMVNGVLTSSSVSNLAGIRKVILPVPAPAITWNVAHNLNSSDAIIQVTDDNGFVVLPDGSQIVDPNNIQITFNSPQTGTVRIIFLD